LDELNPCGCIIIENPERMHIFGETQEKLLVVTRKSFHPPCKRRIRYKLGMQNIKQIVDEFFKTSLTQKETGHYSTLELGDKTSENKLYIY
jgi:hypothetical protein